MALVLAGILALDTADKAAVGATSGNLQRALGMDQTHLGLVVTATGVIGAAGTLPFGALVDRVQRTTLLAIAVALWSLTMVLTALATSFWWLLATRAALGLLAAAAYPAVTSLVGDAFPEDRRARVLGRVMLGELIGTGIGLAIAGLVASTVSWRLAFALLAVPAVVAAWAVHRIDEPARTGARRDDGSAEDDVPLWTALRRVLTIRTNVILIVATSLGYYLFAGIRAFGVPFAHAHYGVSQAVAVSLVLGAGPGGLAGVAVGGRLADRALERGHQDVRIVAPAASLAVAGIFFAPAVVVGSVWAALPLLAVAAFFVGLAYPPLEAARLDVVPPDLWGRAESARVIARTGLEGLAPLVFGVLAQHVFGGESGHGLQRTFLVMLVPLFAGSAVLLLARHAYGDDRAAARRATRRADPGAAAPRAHAAEALR